MISVSSQTPCFLSYVIFTAEGEILLILGESSENAMNDAGKFIFDKVSNVSNWLNLNYKDGTTVN
jgi:hypothetical protein